MAVPTSMSANPFKRAITGIRLGIVPSTQLPPFEVELQRSTANSTASSMWRSDFLAPAGAGYSYTVELPLSTRTFYFRARHVGLGYSAGTFSPTVSAKPVKLGGTFTPIGLPRNKLGNYEALGADLWLSSAKTARVGTQQTTARIQKKIRFPGMSFKPSANGQVFTYSVGTLSGGGSSVSSLACEYGLPRNIVITKYRFYCQRRTTGSTLVVTLYRMSTVGIGSTVSSIATTVNASAQIKESSALNFTVSSSRSFFATLRIKSAPVPNDAIMFWSEFDYEMGTYKDNF